MTKRYSVSVPDELAVKIDQWKGTISPSQVFQHAMEQAITEKEGFQKRLEHDEDMAAAVERLRKERDVESGRYFALGKNNGYTWAKAASYKKLRYVGDNDQLFASKDGVVLVSAIYNDPVLGGYFRGVLADTPALSPLATSAPNSPLSDATAQWLQGWLEGAKEFWRFVSKKL